ncbi:MAG: hypothetical protein FWJ83_01355 [Limnochordales bacterium]
MLRKLTWGLAGFALGAWLMGRTSPRTRRRWMREARQMGRRMERAARRVKKSPGVQWVSEAIQSASPR